MLSDGDVAGLAKRLLMDLGLVNGLVAVPGQIYQKMRNTGPRLTCCSQDEHCDYMERQSCPPSHPRGVVLLGVV